MNPLVAKEIRQLRPALITALLLAVLPVWLCQSDWNSNFRVNDVFGKVAMLFSFGWLLLALTCFGREFGMGTFPVLLALPVTRKRIWWTKIIVLLCAMLIVLVAAVVSAAVWYHLKFGHLVWNNPEDYNFINGTLIITLTFAVVLTSGLWTTLLLRQMMAAVWFAVLVPVLISGLIMWKLDAWIALPIGMALYSAAGLWLAQRMFYRAQEVAWTGGEVTLPGWRSAGAANPATDRAHRPFAALLAKELHIYKITLMGIAALFVLHLGAILLRRAVMNDERYSALSSGLMEFGGLWLLVPIMTAGLNIAEERRLGTLESNLCLPISQRVQFAVKLALALLISGALSGFLLWTAECIGAQLHAGKGFWLLYHTPLNEVSWASVALVFTVVALIVFYASTLARNIWQAIGIAVVFGFFLLWISGINGGIRWNSNSIFWKMPTFDFIVWPALTVAVMRLGFANFRRLSEACRTWLRNFCVLALTCVCGSLLAAGLVHRVWEYLTPLEPAHGPAKLSLSSAPRLQMEWGPAIFMPGGKLWARRIGYQDPKIIRPFGPAYPIFLGEGQWVTVIADDFGRATNWVALAQIYHESAAIRADGTLWLSEKMESTMDYDGAGLHVNPHKPVPLIRFGQEADWKDVVPLGGDAVMLLKGEGTLWLWGGKYNKDFPGLQTMSPVRLGADADWERILSTPMGLLIWRKNGQAWRQIYRYSTNAVSPQEIELTPDFALQRFPVFNNMKIRSFAMSIQTWLVVQENGTLWTWNDRQADPKGDIFIVGARQVGTETNWISVAGGNDELLGLKSDGTLWRWNVPYNDLPTFSPFEKPPVRLGTHNDWVALAGQRAGWALAADGSLWLYNSGRGNYVWLVPSRKPDEVANVFSQ